MKPVATIFAAVASMGLVSACATANGQTGNVSAAEVVAASDDSDGERHVRVIRMGGRDRDFKSVIENYDTDDDGKISRGEYDDRPNRGRFDALDADEDGFIDQAELEGDMEERFAKRMQRMTERMERRAGRIERHAERMMRDAGRYEEEILGRLDRNGDGEVNGDDFDIEFDFDFDEEALEEKMQAFREHMEERMQAHRERSMKRLDSDENGVISREEFAARQNKRFDKLDKDGNGTLSADELDGMAMMRGFSMRGMPHGDGFARGRHNRGRHMFRQHHQEDGASEDENGDAGE